LAEADDRDAFRTSASAKDRYAGDGKDFEDVFIAVVGPTGCGKSSFIKLLTGQDVPIGHTIEACTTEVADFSFIYKKFRVHLLDTPALDDIESHPEHVLMTYLRDDHIALTGMIYLDRITDPRSAEGLPVLEDVLQALRARMGWNCLGKLFTATTQWDGVNPRGALAREKVLMQEGFSKLPFAQASKVFRHWNTRGSAFTIIDGVLESVGVHRS
jgi:energy-coupling factor transporter ATP-binding protein EcfA2